MRGKRPKARKSSNILSKAEIYNPHVSWRERSAFIGEQNCGLNLVEGTIRRYETIMTLGAMEYQQLVSVQ